MKMFLVLLVGFAIGTSSNAKAGEINKVCRSAFARYELIIDPTRAYVIEDLSAPVIFYEADMSSYSGLNRFQIVGKNSDGSELDARIHGSIAKVRVVAPNGATISFVGFCKNY